MALISRAIPGLFGGVSQVIPAMRHATQGAEQLNALSTVVQGLFKRPGTRHVAQLPMVWAAGDPEAGQAFCHVIERRDQPRYEVVFLHESVTVVNMDTGATEPVEYRDTTGTPIGSPQLYLQATSPAFSLRAITVADTTFIVNSEALIASQNNDSEAPSTTTAYIYVKQGVPSQSYVVLLNGNYLQYDTTSTGVNVGTVATGMVALLNTQPGVTATTTAVLGLIEVNVPAGITSISVTDTFGNTTMTLMGDNIPKYSDLPPFFHVAGPRFTITGGEAAGGNVDPYYVRWDGHKWVETRKYGAQTHLNPDTMPHRMYRDDTLSKWIIEPCVWDERLVGDDNTNPLPSFVGRTIRDIFFYRNRLGFLSGDSLVMSRSGEFFNFFSTTAREVLDTDPIDIGGAAESVDSLDWAVPFNEQLIIWASSKQQFSLLGGDVLSPETARLAPTTAFETVNSARPKQLGNRILFPSNLNGFTQLALYRVSKDTVSNTAEPITEQVPTYIPVSPHSIEVAETAKMMCVVSPGAGKDLYVFKYEDDGDKLTQRAWQKFTFEGGIVKAHWSGQRLYLTMLYADADGDDRSTMTIEVMDFAESAVDPSLSYEMRLDRRTFVNSATSVGGGEYELSVTMPFSPGLKVYQYSPTTDPVELTVVSITSSADAICVLTIRVKALSGTGTFVVGVPYTFRYTFTEVVMRDKDGVPVMDTRLKVLKMLVRYVATGYFKALVLTKAQVLYEYVFSGQGVGLGLVLGAQRPLVDGEFAIPVQSQAAGTVISLESTSPFPCCFPYAEWRGSLNMKSNR